MQPAVLLSRATARSTTVPSRHWVDVSDSTDGGRRPLRLLVVAVLFVFAFLSTSAARAAQAPVLDWQPCAEGFECATAEVPRDYTRPNGPKLRLAVTRLTAQDQASRIGSLFVNFGGPGGTAVDLLQAIGPFLFADLNQRFDIVAFDPRGVGQSSPAIDCRVNQETQGLYAQPFTTPYNLSIAAWSARAHSYVEACVRNNKPSILRSASTGNVARDLDLLRAAVGDAKLTYLGFSYGTFLGATYASLFPNNYRALVLDGAVDADRYINHATATLREQSAGYERAFDRFFQACAADQETCLGFGGADPHSAFDQLVARANRNPIPAGGDDPRPVDGEDILAGAVITLYAKQNWPVLAQALAAAEAGDGTIMRMLVDFYYGRFPDGTYDAFGDRYFVLSAIEQRYPSAPRFFLEAGEHSYNLFDHTWWNTGYSELPIGIFPVQAQGAFYGPFRARSSAPTVLVVGTIYDPATPYHGAVGLVHQLGNARLLTMWGDGHTAYGGNSPCIDAAVNAYLIAGTLPAPGTICQQEVEFEPPPPGLQRRLQRKPVYRLLRADPRIAWAFR
jgi:pimeloyl-ACP methyl ester carboxylesterase